MTFKPEHVGLYFGQEQIDLVKNERDSDSILNVAWQWMLAKEGEIVYEIKPDKKHPDGRVIKKPSLTGISSAIASATRYRLTGDVSYGEKAVSVLSNTLKDKSTLVETVMETVAAGHLFELCRPLADEAWLKQFAAYSDSLLKADNPTNLEKLWLITLGIVSGIVLDDESRFNSACEKFHAVIDSGIHPEGYLKSLVDEENNATFREMTFGTVALVLSAEAATQAGVDLWSYENRDVGVITAVTYLVYYYFYPDKWHWKDAFTEDDTRALYEEFGAFIEMAAYRGKARGADILQDEQRPFFSGIVGGLTTLTHGKIPKRKRRWFGL